MKKLLNKKGFTIVELVIVIAVIAVLAAVLIPTFSSLIEKANISSDTALVRNINQFMLIDEVTGGKKNNIGDALKAAEDGGHTIEKLTPKSSGDIIWNEETGKFVLISEEGKVIYSSGDETDENSTEKLYENSKYKLWKIINDKVENRKEALEEDGYSKYFDCDDEIEELTISTGLYLGDNTNVNKVVFNTEDDRTVLINTNGGSLEVDAANATVNHNGKVLSVNIKAVASNSYHEYGKVEGKIEITSGRVVMENGGSANQINVSSDATNVKVEANGTTVTVPSDKQSSVEVTGTEVISLNEEDIQKMNLFAGGIGTEASPYIISSEENFKNLNEYFGNDVNNLKFEDVYFKQVNDLTITSEGYEVEYFSGNYDGGNHSIEFKVSKTNDKIYSVFKNVYGKKGTDLTIKNLEVVENELNPTVLIWFACGGKSWVFSPEKLTIDNVIINSSDNKIIKVNNSNFGLFIAQAIYIAKEYESEPDARIVTFKNCINNVSFENSGVSTGVFVGSGICDGNIVSYINCVNNGNVTGTSNVGVLYGNPSYTLDKETIEVNNFKNNGTIFSSKSEGNVSVAPKSDKPNNTINDLIEQLNNECGGKYASNTYFNDKTIYINQDSNNSFSINLNDDGYEYKIGFMIGRIENDNGTFSNGTYYSYDLVKDVSISEISISNTFKAIEYGKYKETIEDVELSFDENGICFVTKEDVTYLVFETRLINRDLTLEEDKQGISSVTLYVYAYYNNSLKGVIKIK